MTMPGMMMKNKTQKPMSYEVGGKVVKICAKCPSPAKCKKAGKCLLKTKGRVV
jgi:hypothetical protein